MPRQRVDKRPGYGSIQRALEKGRIGVQHPGMSIVRLPISVASDCLLVLRPIATLGSGYWKHAAQLGMHCCHLAYWPAHAPRPRTPSAPAPPCHVPSSPHCAISQVVSRPFGLRDPNWYSGAPTAAKGIEASRPLDCHRGSRDARSQGTPDHRPEARSGELGRARHEAAQPWRGLGRGSARVPHRHWPRRLSAVR